MLNALNAIGNYQVRRGVCFEGVFSYTPHAAVRGDNARFAAYFFGNGEKWISMTKFNTNKYYVVKPEGYPNVIFCRMNGGTSANNWNNKWNQTKDLTIPSDKNTCTISNYWSSSGATGTWSLK